MGCSVCVVASPRLHQLEVDGLPGFRFLSGLDEKDGVAHFDQSEKSFNILISNLEWMTTRLLG
jgi:hypothetical protein